MINLDDKLPYMCINLFSVSKNCYICTMHYFSRLNRMMTSREIRINVAVRGLVRAKRATARRHQHSSLRTVRVKVYLGFFLFQ